MIKYEQIFLSIVEKLNSMFINVPVESNNITEGFARPSFYVNLDNAISSDWMESNRERNITVDITYFPKDSRKNQIDLLETMETMESMTKDNIIVDGYIVDVDNLTLDIVDNNGKVLKCSFTIYFDERYEVEIKPNMDNLDLKVAPTDKKADLK